jgi:hypothetical protein
VAVVIDWSKYCHGVVSVDPDARTAIVEPGIVLDELNAQPLFWISSSPPAEPETGHPGCASSLARVRIRPRSRR